MFRIALLITMLFAAATQGFARKVDVEFVGPSQVETVAQLISELKSPECCGETKFLVSNPTYCKSDCKGVISAATIMPSAAGESLDALVILHHAGHHVVIEPGPPKS